MRAAVTGLVAVLWGAIVLLAHPHSTAASSCHKGCKDEIVACRRSQCSGLFGAARRDCLNGCSLRSTCTAPGGAIRTLAYVVNECRSDRSGPQEMSSLTQKLMIRRGNCDPVTIREYRRDPVPDPAGICRLFGDTRVGTTSVFAGVFQRTGVSPDGSVVLFEVTDEFSIPALSPLTPHVADAEKGIFLVRADGTGLRRLGDATHSPTFSTEKGSSINDILFAFSPDRTTIAFTDLGPGADGLPSLQIFTMDLASGARRQLTQFTLRRPPEFFPALIAPTFADDRTIIFEAVVDASNPSERDAGLVSYSVRVDGSDLHQLAASLVPIPGANVIPRFDVTRGGTHVAYVTLRGEPSDPVAHSPGRYRELFAFDRQHVLQLTNYRSFDTHLPVVNRGRVFFLASADPVGTNPGHICQLFSVNVLGGDVRQLTRFEDSRPFAGCFYEPGNACTLSSGVLADPVTGTVVFPANCNPSFGTNPNGDQIFAVRPDGTGLRQLTSLRGVQTLADGTLLVELPGPVNYSAPVP
jgi:hypothetical protein